jgi:hypothetical protein
MVQHLIDYDTSHIKDSTSNNNNGTKKGANEPIEADGKIAKGQSFDGSNDYINCEAINFIGADKKFTVEAWVNVSTLAAVKQLVARGYANRDVQGDTQMRVEDTYGHIVVDLYHSGRDWYSFTSSGTISADTWSYLVMESDGTTLKLFINTTEDNNNVDISARSVSDSSNTNKVTLGAYPGSTYSSFIHGTIDEVRISNTDRTAAWRKASYNSGNDTLLKYLKEETLFSRRGIFYVPINTSNFFHFFR